MDKHTPGPWEIRESKEGEGVCIYAGKYGIGKVWDLNGNPENEANASLIAAAPVMLAELKRLRLAYVNLLESGRDRIVALGGSCDPVDVMEAGDPAIRRANEVIAKAEGQPTRPDGPVLREGVENV